MAAKKAGETTATVSLDLNRTETEVALTEAGVTLPEGPTLLWAEVAKIDEDDHGCFLIHEGVPHRIHVFSETTRRSCSLRATEKAPTMILAGFPMHRIKDVDPIEDTRRKIQTLMPVFGRVLDTATGLGYTAIAAAETASEVVTIELDPGVLAIAKRNPHSQELFTNTKIKQKMGSSFEVLPTLEDSSFARIFHDPPTRQLAGELYSEEFYGQLYRVLKKNGKLFHYVGDLNSTYGSSVMKGAIRRLQNVGFTKVTRAPEAFGLIALK